VKYQNVCGRFWRRKRKKTNNFIGLAVMDWFDQFFERRNFAWSVSARRAICEPSVQLMRACQNFTGEISRRLIAVVIAFYEIYHQLRQLIVSTLKNASRDN
jgi:hypothetical protein